MEKPAPLAGLANRYGGRFPLKARRLWHFDRRLAVALIALSVLAAFSLWQAHLLLLDREVTRQQLASLEVISRPDRHAVNLDSLDVKAATLPTGPEAAAVLATLASTSRQLGLGLGEISSMIEREPSQPRLRQSFEFQARGSFKAIGGLTAEMLRQHQTLALDSINAERADGDSAIVVASLRFSLFIEP